MPERAFRDVTREIHVRREINGHPGQAARAGEFSRRGSGPYEPGYRLGGFADFLGRAVTAFGHGLRDAVAWVLVQQAEGN